MGLEFEIRVRKIEDQMLQYDCKGSGATVL